MWKLVIFAALAAVVCARPKWHSRKNHEGSKDAKTVPESVAVPPPVAWTKTVGAHNPLQSDQILDQLVADTKLEELLMILNKSIMTIVIGTPKECEKVVAARLSVGISKFFANKHLSAAFDLLSTDTAEDILAVPDTDSLSASYSMDDLYSEAESAMDALGEHYLAMVETYFGDLLNGVWDADYAVEDEFYQLTDFILEEAELKKVTIRMLLEKVKESLQRVVSVTDPATTCAQIPSDLGTNVKSSLEDFVAELEATTVDSITTLLLEDNLVVSQKTRSLMEIILPILKTVKPFQAILATMKPTSSPLDTAKLLSVEIGDIIGFRTMGSIAVEEEVRHYLESKKEEITAMLAKIFSVGKEIDFEMFVAMLTRMAVRLHGFGLSPEELEGVYLAMVEEVSTLPVGKAGMASGSTDNGENGIQSMSSNSRQIAKQMRELLNALRAQ